MCHSSSRTGGTPGLPVPVNDAVCSRVFKVSPTSPNTGVGSVPFWRAEGQLRACPKVAPMPVVHEAWALACVERVAN